MNHIFYILAAPYVLALAVWGYCAVALSRANVGLGKAAPQNAAALRFFPLVAIGAMCATLMYPFLVQRGASIGAVVVTAGCSAALHLYLVYLSLFHGVWALAAILKPEGKPMAEAIQASYSRAAQAKSMLIGALLVTMLLLGLKIFVLFRLMMFARANFPATIQ